MLPKRIYLKDFMGHTESDIDCTKFSSCLIVGKNKNNPNISNGVGKSTIYKAIEYVLYGEYACDKVEEIIRDGADSCKVIFEFLLENTDYQVIRQRSKSGTHLYLNRLVGENWESLTAKTNTQTEAELLKLIKISYKAFRNSISFAQSDFDGIASASPDKRKELLKEPLNILIYNKYHKIAKKKLDDQTKELEKNQILISSLGQPENELKFCIIKIYEAEEILKVKRIKYNELNNELNIKRVELSELDKLINSESVDINAQLIEVKDRIKEVERDLVRVNSEHSVSLKKIQEYKIELSYKTQYSKPIPKVGKCGECFQIVNENHRDACVKKSAEKLEIILKDLEKYQDGMKKCTAKRKSLEQEQRDISRKLSQINSYELDIANGKNNIHKTEELINQYNETIDAKNNDIIRLKSSIEQLKIKELVLFENAKKFNIDEINIKIVNIKNNIKDVENNIKVLLQQISSDDTLFGILNEKKSNIEENILKLNNLLVEGKVIEDRVSILQKVASAMLTSIPNLIIASILDDLKIEANVLLSNLRNDMQIEFSLDKDNDNLDIIYLINNKQRKYSQLSGGQHVFVNISLKLGLSKVLQKRLGVDIKFLLLDEVDSALDYNGVDALAEIIKKWQKDFMIFLITHNRFLREKNINNYILVESDEEGSKARYSTTWDI